MFERKRILLAALCALACQAPATQAQQASGETAGSTLESVTVTARRREESAQDVPVVVNVFTPKILAEQDMRTFTDMERMMPGVSTCCARGSVGSYTFIRGVNSAAGYFAEVPTSLNGSAMFFDLANVQVLKGPQGTLFGIATNGGAILYEPQRPTDRLEGYASTTLGDYGRRTIEGVVNIPVTDNFLLRVGGVSQHSDGYVKDVTNRLMLGTEDYWTARVSAQWKITDALSNYTVINYSDSDSIPAPGGVPFGPNAGIDPNGLFAKTFGGPALQAWIAQQESLGRYAIVGNDVPGGPRSVLKQTNVVNTTSYEISPSLTVKNIMGFSSIDTAGSRSDTDATPFPAFETSFPTDFSGPNNTYSEELQLQGNAFDNKLTYVIGTFNRWLRQDDPAISYSFSLGNRAGTLSSVEGETNSIFAEGTYKLDDWVDGLGFTAGYRYTWDEREALQQRYNAAGVQVSQYAAKGKWDQGSYRWGFTYNFTPSVMAYFTNSKGYSAGGFNLTAPPSLQIYNPESMDNYEVGLKSEWDIAGHPGRANISAYYGKWDNMQTQVTSRCETPTGIVFCQLTRNAATGEIKGFEAEIAFNPTDSLALSTAFGYMDGSYTNFFGLSPTGDCCLDLSGVPFLYIPKWKYNVNATYTLPVDQSVGDISVGAAYSFTDNIRTIFTTDGVDGFYNTQPQMKNLNLNLNWRDFLGRQGLEAKLLVTNVTQDTVLHGQWGVYQTLGQYGRAVALPRMWSVALKYSF